MTKKAPPPIRLRAERRISGASLRLARDDAGLIAYEAAWAIRTIGQEHPDWSTLTVVVRRYDDHYWVSATADRVAPDTLPGQPGG